MWYAFYKPSSNIENHMTVCMEYPAKSPYEDEPENAAGKGQEHHAERTVQEQWYSISFQKGWFAYDKTEPA